VWILSGHGLVVSNCFLKMNWFIFCVNQCFITNSNLATVTFLNFGLNWAKSFLRCRSMHLKLLYLFRIPIWLCEAGFSKSIKRNSDLDWFPKMTWEYHFQPLFPECEILCIENKHRSITELLAGWNCLSFFNRRKIKHSWLYIPSS